MQVVFSGRTSLATSHFSTLGYTVPSPNVSIADYVLDLVIKVRTIYTHTPHTHAVHRNRAVWLSDGHTMSHDVSYATDN